MRAKTTYHCHTVWSDGLMSVSELLEAAEQKGFTEIGISDHLVIHPDGKQLPWALDSGKLDEYLQEFNEAKESVNISVKLGFEVDFFPSNPRENELREILNSVEYNYLIGSIHLVDGFPIDDTEENWKKLSQDEVNEIYIKYWDYMSLLARDLEVDIIGHIDLPKKFNFQPTIDLQEKIYKAVCVIAETGKKVEINTAGWDKPCKEQYPSLDIIKMCRQHRIPIIINDDAHSPEELGRYFQKATELLK